MQFGVSGEFDRDASNFLRSLGAGLLPTDPNFPNSGPGTLFFANPEQKSNSLLYANTLVTNADFYQKNNLGAPTPQQIRDAASRDSQIRERVAKQTIAATVVSGGIVAAGVAPTIIAACLANPVVCNQLGLTTAEVLSEGGVVAGGSIATKKAIDAGIDVTKTIITKDIEDKILLGQRVINADGSKSNRLIGAHSGEINNANPKFAVEELSANTDGTRTVKLLTQFDDGNLSRIKTSTLFPDGWTSSQIIEAVKLTGDTTRIAIRPDGATLHQTLINGIKVEVIKIGNKVTAAYPCGRGCTSVSAFTGK